MFSIRHFCSLITLLHSRDTCDPVWERDNVFDFPIEVVQGQELLLEFYDDDDRKDDEFMGRAKIQTSVVAERGHVEVSISHHYHDDYHHHHVI